MDIHHSSIKDFILPKVRSVIVIDYYEGIQGTLEARDDFPYKNFLANPRQRTQTEIIWSTDVFSDTPVLLKDLHDNQKEKYSCLLKERIDSLETLIHTLQEEGSTDVAELLQKSLCYIDDKSVYCADGKIVVVNWGLIPRRDELSGGSIYRSGKFVGNWVDLKPRTEIVDKSNIHKNKSSDSFPEISVEKDSSAVHNDPVYNDPVHNDLVHNDLVHNEPVHNEPVHNEPVHNEQTQDTKTVQNTPDVTNVSNYDSNSEIKQDTEKLRGVPNVADVTSPKTGQLTQEQNTSPMVSGLVNNSVSDTKNSKPDSSESDISSSKVKDTSSLETKTTIKSGHTVLNKTSEIPHGVKNEYSWSIFFKGFYGGLLFLLRKLWLLVLLVLLLLLVMYLGRYYQGEINQINPFFSPLPKKSIVMPVDKDAVEKSDDGMTKVATDRLNILLEKTGDNTMLEWARAFKKEYSSSDYKVFYYNEELYNLQIKVPVDKREQVKKEIHDKLKGFSFEIFDEMVYESDFISFNDPEISNQNHSWFLNSIGAYEAWEFTLGDPEVVVAVVDNGFDTNHTELKGKIVHPYNVLTQNNRLRPILTNKGVDAHGTHVAATAVGNCNNGSGLLGIAPLCKLMPVQVGNDDPIGNMSNQAVMEGVMYAINQGADVVNVSLGMCLSDNILKMSEGEQMNVINSYYKEEEFLWNKIFEKAKKRNTIIVFAAGNDNVIAGIDPKKRNNSTVRVSAVDTSLDKASFSNYGRFEQYNCVYSSVSAPGVQIYSAAPDGQYKSMQGTSMAAPIVSGSIALLKSANKNITADQAIALLKSTGTEVNPKIGPLINLSKAIKDAFNGQKPINCQDVARQIEKLNAKIDSLKQLCPGAGEPADTLKYDDAVKNKHGLDGMWKTTTKLYASTDNTPIELYMQFHKLKGVLIIKNKGLVFKAPLTAKISKKKITINQDTDAICPGTNIFFCKYKYECNSDSKGNLKCKATSKNGSVTFNLIRVN